MTKVVPETKTARWLPNPAVDSQKVGLGFIAVGYGVVLVAVFPAQARTLSRIGIEGWFHLIFAAAMLVVSWMGYYTNRTKYPVWTVQFFNIPLVQYLISFAILFGYWELGVTVRNPGPFGPAPRPEAFITLMVFFAYLVWDFLEIAIQENCKYVKELQEQNLCSFLPPVCQTGKWKPMRRTMTKWHTDRRGTWFAKDLRLGRFVTLVFTCIYAVMLYLVINGTFHTRLGVVVFDSGYIVSLLLYRYLQWVSAERWYR